jgi:glycerophosphodiester phosphodiesterase
MERYQPSPSLAKSLDREELEDLIGVLVDLRSQLRKLQWYAEVNKRGFVKILKKFDKKIGTHTQTKYLTSKIFILQFSNGNAILDKIGITNSYLSDLSPASGEDSQKGGSSTQKIEEYEAKKSLYRASSLNSSTSSLIEETEWRDAITNDDCGQLAHIIGKGVVSQKVLLTMLTKALLANARNSVDLLLDRIDTFEDPTELNCRTVIHKLVINCGRQVSQHDAELASNHNKYLHPAVIPSTHVPLGKALGSDGAQARDDTEMLAYLLDHLKPNQHDGLTATDQHLRTPLHYAAYYGLKHMTSVILNRMREWKMIDFNNGGIMGAEWRDSEGHTPIELAVSGNHPQTAQVLLDQGIDMQSKLTRGKISSLVSIAARLDSAQLISVLVGAGVDINYIGSGESETPLYVAVKMNHIEAARALVAHGASTEISESAFGWTPVFIAAVEGYTDAAKILLEAGADISRTDGSGWTAMEHACLRGHMELTDILAPPSPSLIKDIGSRSPAPLTTMTDTALVKSLAKMELDKGADSDAIKTFGHRYLESKALVLVTLGTNDTRYIENPVELSTIPLSEAHTTELDTALSLVVSAKGVEGDPIVIDLPLPEFGMSLEPISFYTSNANDVKLYFDLVPTYSNKRKILGRAVALLSSIYKGVGNHMANLSETLTLPIIGSENLEVLGNVKFSAKVITPFSHPNMGIEKSSTYWKSLVSTRVIGHRGLGKNSTSKKSLQLGENTLESFIQAANLGASYVEFDVQLTRDLVPVIYHDFLVSESGIDIPMHSLTFEQFMNFCKPSIKSSGERVSASPERGPSGKKRMPSPESRPRRTMSLFTGDKGDEYDAMVQRMQFTRDFKIKGFKGNFRGHSIQSPFTTLEEVFKMLPKNVGFNIECKYPMLHESELEGMDSMAIDLNVWVDTVLQTVYDHADGRDIILSSFHPDICILLSLKQPSIPVLFLTEGGTAPMADIRASSLQEAVRFARRWNLLGIVSECTPLIKCPRLVNVIKGSGLVCVTYGTGNNNPVNARLQTRAGVDAVIVDSVLAVRRGLTVEDSEPNEDGSLTVEPIREDVSPTKDVDMDVDRVPATPSTTLALV